MTDKWWEATIKHALQCERGNKHYLYYVAGTEIVLVFNSIFELVGAKTDGLYHSMDELSAHQKAILNNFKKLAYKNSRDIVEFSDTLNVTSFLGSSLSDPHNANIQVRFHGMPSSQAGLHPIHQSASAQKPDSSNVSNVNKSGSLSIPGSCSSQMPIIQAAAPGKQMNSIVLSNEQGIIVVPRSASFRTNCSFPEFFFDELLQCQLPDEECWELLQPTGEESHAPLSPLMLKKLITVVKWLSIIKRPVARRARILPHSRLNA